MFTIDLLDEQGNAVHRFKSTHIPAVTDTINLLKFTKTYEVKKVELVITEFGLDIARLTVQEIFPYTVNPKIWQNGTPVC